MLLSPPLKRPPNSQSRFRASLWSWVWVNDLFGIIITIIITTHTRLQPGDAQGAPAHNYSLNGVLGDLCDIWGHEVRVLK